MQLPTQAQIRSSGLNEGISDQWMAVRRMDGVAQDWVQLGTHASVPRYASYMDTLGFGAGPAWGLTRTWHSWRARSAAFVYAVLVCDFAEEASCSRLWLKGPWARSRANWAGWAKARVQVRKCAQRPASGEACEDAGRVVKDFRTDHGHDTRAEGVCFARGGDGCYSLEVRNELRTHGAEAAVAGRRFFLGSGAGEPPEFA